jgi:hypothetical protein
MSDQTMTCPKCTSSSLAQPTSIFIEYGEFNGKAYDEEGFADVHRCVECGFQFASLAAFNLDTLSEDDGEVPTAA